MKSKTHVRAGVVSVNHNETVVRDSAKGQGPKVKTRIKAGVLTYNHNETLVVETLRRCERIAQGRRPTPLIVHPRVTMSRVS